jgi:Flp pilus assembly protein TadD
LLALAESLATRSYLVHWRDSVGLFEYMLTKAPNAPSLHHDLGFAYGTLGRWQEAVEMYKEAIRIKPSDAEAHCNLGIAYLKIGDKNAALEEYKILKMLDTEKADKLFNFISSVGK